VSTNTGQNLNEQRQAYAQAVKAIELRDWLDYERLRQALNDYPLAIYLDYFRLTGQTNTVGLSEARRFLSASADTPLSNRFLIVYLRELGKAQDWQNFLQALPGEPNSVDLKCYFFRAQLAQGNKETAWEGAQRLWIEGKSQPAACDPLFKAWESAGKLTDAIVWTRLLNAFDARQRGLLQFIARKGSAQLQPWTDKLLAVDSKPESLTRQSLPANSPYSADIASHGLVYLASYSPAKALAYWTELQPLLHFNLQQAHEVEYAIALQSLFARDASHSAWLDTVLARLKDDKLTGIRLRWALKEQDWDALSRTLPQLSESAQTENVWRYWQAIAQERSGNAAAAKVTFEQLAGERDYYGFLSADKLGRPYAFNHQRFALSDNSSVLRLPALGRIEELKYHGEETLAQAEWYKLLQDTTDSAQQRDLALLATQKGWYRQAIDAATSAQVWDALDQRFPTPYREVFQRNASAQQVPSTELMAIARRESAFFPQAQSPVGARGLMQIMPATGQAVASSLRRRHSSADLFEIEHNVALGSAYYRQLLDRYGDNRIFALTAYNAGPNRVDRWRNSAGRGIPVDLWIETIPYQETRNYVQAVLSYNVVFQYVLGNTQSLLTPQERKASY
jgi:soluble lytic murein transglycosylase